MGFLKKVAKVLTKPTEVMLDGIKDVAMPIVKELTGEAAAERSAKLQDEYNLKYWNMQNEYNTPSAQMQRFIDAGLNPNLAYSLSNTAGDVGRVSVQTPDNALGVASKVIGAISAWQGIKNMKLQNSNLSAQNNLIGTQSDFTKEQARRLRIDNDWLERNGLSSLSDVWEKRARSGASYLLDFVGLPVNLGRQTSDWIQNRVQWLRGDKR